MIDDGPGWEQQMETEKRQQEEETMKQTNKNIFQRMHDVMMSLDYVKKEDKKVNGQYTFVSHDAVTAAVRREMVKAGIVSIPSVISASQDGNRTSVDMSIKFVNIDNPEDFVEVKSFGYGIDNQDKGPGKAVSYAVKYAYLKAFALETGDDPERDMIEYDSGLEDRKKDFIARLETVDSINDLRELYKEAQEFCKKTQETNFFKMFKGRAKRVNDELTTMTNSNEE